MQEIRIGMSSFIADVFLAPIIKAIRSKVVSIQVNTSTASELNNQFLQRKLDCVISSRLFDIVDQITEREICQQGLLGIYSSSLSKEIRGEISLDFLLENTLFIDFPVSTQIGRLIKQFFFRLQKRPNKIISVDTVPNALQILRATPSWSICLPLAMANYTSLIQDGFIQYFTLPEPSLHADIYLSVSVNFPQELLDNIDSTLKNQLDQVIIKEQLASLPTFQNLIKVLI